MNNRYILTYTTVMTLIVAVVLAFVVTGLKPIHDLNEAVFKKRDILSAVKYELPTPIDEMSDEDVAAFFESKITQVVLDANGQKVGDNADAIDMKKEEKKPLEERKYPLYIYKSEKGTFYLTSVRGNGLWDKIWATVAIKDDFNTIAGISFDHVTETAGLGAEIKDNEAWKRDFIGKQLYNDQGEYVSVEAVKGGVKKPDHQVDAIAGATITSDGVSEMMDRGMKVYLPYFESLKK
jgi:Na+-transporting NADH:ubiquinone oxidoreductase subunit C